MLLRTVYQPHSQQLVLMPQRWGHQLCVLPGPLPVCLHQSLQCLGWATEFVCASRGWCVRRVRGMMSWVWCGAESWAMMGHVQCIAELHAHRLFFSLLLFLHTLLRCERCVRPALFEFLSWSHTRLPCSWMSIGPCFHHIHRIFACWDAGCTLPG